MVSVEHEINPLFRKGFSKGLISWLLEKKKKEKKAAVPISVNVAEQVDLQCFKEKWHKTFTWHNRMRGYVLCTPKSCRDFVLEVNPRRWLDRTIEIMP